MPNSSAEFQIGKARYLIFAAITGFIALSTDLSHQSFNSILLFHEGEYVGLLWHMRDHYAGTVAFPVLIHGAMDYIPSLVSANVYGDDYVIVGTRAINTIIVWICWVLYLDLIYLLCANPGQRKYWTALALAILLVITPGLGSNSFTVHEAFLAVRDLFLIAVIWAFAQHTAAHTQIGRRVFLSLGAVCTVIAIFWSYDRGLMAIAFSGIIWLGLVHKKQLVDAAVMALAAIATALILEVAGIAGSFADNIYNIVYWIRNGSGIFGSTTSNLTLVVVIFLIYIFCFMAVAQAFREKYYRDERNLAVVTGLIVIQLLLLATIMNQPGMPRILMAVWPSIVIMIYLASRNVPLSGRSAPAAAIPQIYKASLAVIVMLAWITSGWFVWGGGFMSNLTAPRSNEAVTPAAVVQLAATLRQHDDQCVFGWANEGVVALLAKKRFCTRFPYAIYVAESEEQDFLSQLQADAPKAIAFEVKGVSMMNIGKRSMQARLPKVHEFIKTNYPNEQWIGRYLVVSK